jgi:hypothetical protein
MAWLTRSQGRDHFKGISVFFLHSLHRVPRQTAKAVDVGSGFNHQETTNLLDRSRWV